MRSAWIFIRASFRLPVQQALADGQIGEGPALHHPCADRVGIHLELDEFHGVLNKLLAGVQVLDLDGVANGTPVILF